MEVQKNVCEEPWQIYDDKYFKFFHPTSPANNIKDSFLPKMKILAQIDQTSIASMTKFQLVCDPAFIYIFIYIYIYMMTFPDLIEMWSSLHLWNVSNCFRYLKNQLSGLDEMSVSPLVQDIPFEIKVFSYVCTLD